jgi:hypothetical protein
MEHFETVYVMELIEMLSLKTCPRCRGDILTNRDMYGEYRECLQCGYMVDISKPSRLRVLRTPRPNDDAA